MQDQVSRCEADALVAEALKVQERLKRLILETDELIAKTKRLTEELGQEQGDHGMLFAVR